MSWASSVFIFRSSLKSPCDHLSIAAAIIRRLLSLLISSNLVSAEVIDTADTLAYRSPIWCPVVLLSLTPLCDHLSVAAVILHDLLSSLGSSVSVPVEVVGTVDVLTC